MGTLPLLRVVGGQPLKTGRRQNRHRPVAGGLGERLTVRDRQSDGFSRGPCILVGAGIEALTFAVGHDQAITHTRHRDPDDLLWSRVGGSARLCRRNTEPGPESLEISVVAEGRRARLVAPCMCSLPGHAAVGIDEQATPAPTADIETHIKTPCCHHPLIPCFVD